MIRRICMNERCLVAVAWATWLLVSSCLVTAIAVASETVTIDSADSVSPINGTLREWSADKIVVVSDEKPLTTPLNDLLSMSFGRQAVPMSGGDPLVILANGDRMVLRPVGVFDDELSATWHKIPSRPMLKLPLETVSAIVFELPAATDDRQRLYAALQTLPPGDDIVLLANGDRVQGEFERLDGAFIHLKKATGLLKLDRSRVQAIRLNPELTAEVRMPGRRLMLSLRDGSRVTLQRAEMSGNDVKGETFSKLEVMVPVSECVAMRVYGTRAIALSEREPSQINFVPYLSHNWPLVKNANVLRGPLSLRGVEYGTGLGVHSRSLVTYDVKPGDREFRATVGIDDAAAGSGSVQFRVEVDGSKVWTSPELTGRSAALAVPPVPLGDAKKLTLIVDFGANADVQDYANWCDAVILVK